MKLTFELSNGDCVTAKSAFDCDRGDLIDVYDEDYGEFLCEFCGVLPDEVTDNFIKKVEEEIALAEHN